MDPQRPRWRIRLSTLMLLVIIAALASYIVAERWHREQQARRLETSLQRAMAGAEQARARAVLFQMQAAAGGPGGDSAGEKAKGE